MFSRVLKFNDFFMFGHRTYAFGARLKLGGIMVWKWGKIPVAR